jgi:hypothetical protein
MISSRGLRSLAAGLLFCAAALPAATQSPPPLPALPERHDTLTAVYAGTVIGRGVMTWTRSGLEQLQVYIWISAADGMKVIDSLFADPTSLRPVREVRAIGDTVVTVLYARDTVFLATASAGARRSSHPHRSNRWPRPCRSAAAARGSPSCSTPRHPASVCSESRSAWRTFRSWADVPRGA